MRAYIGVGADSGSVHAGRGTAGNVHDVMQANSLLHGQESGVFADAGYKGAATWPEATAAMRLGKCRVMEKIERSTPRSAR